MASTIAIYTGDGTTTDFTVPFDYLARKFVKVSVGLTELEGGDYGDTSKDFYFLDKTTVRLKTAPQAGAEVTIRRYTSATDRVVSFKDASILKANDLDTSSIQTIHIAEEGREVINDALIVDKEGNWDAKGHRVANVGDAVDDGDAVNLKLYKADAKGAYQARVEAEKARDRAVEAETNAKASEVKAKESETNAKVSETVAKASAGTAISASKHADYVKTENEKLLGETKKSEASAKASANTATAQATISTQKANEAMGYARDAKVSEDNAMASEVAAEGSAELATQKANEADADATSASRSATAADASAKNSANSASTATQQATLATQKATEAKTNADKAALSKDATKVSETNAKKSETNAKVSETNAKVSETEATAQAERAKSYADQASSGQVNADWNETVPTSKAFIKNKPKLFSGSYTDLTNKPTLGTLSSKNSLAYSELTGVPTEFTPKTHIHSITQVTDLQSALDGKANDATLQTDLTAIRKSVDAVSKKVDGIGDTLSPTYAKKQGILDACDKALNGANPVHAGDPTLDEIKLALATIQAQLGQLESRRYVKETGKSSDGTSWYRVWSDGWIEQGGTYTSSDNNNYPVTLSKKMTTTNYHSTVTGGFNMATSNGFGHCYDKTTSGFKAVVVRPMGTWYVCGY